MADKKNKTRDEIENEDEPLIITLEFDDGDEIETEALGIFEALGKEYIALAPHDDTDDVYIYGYKEIGDEEFELIDIEDEEEFNKVVEEFDALMADE